MATVERPDSFRPFLKWPGGKYRLLDKIGNRLPHGRRLIEPFVGSGAVFINMDYSRYLLGDGNEDLIQLFTTLKQGGEDFIEYCAEFFTPEFNTEEVYYQSRLTFNHISHSDYKSALFIYLNRHCYNGLCRYNSKGQFNTPFGRYKKPYFPRDEMRSFIRASKQAKFIHSHFTDTMARARKGDVVYCDPPYVPLSATANFTDYFAGGFNADDQVQLAESAARLSRKGIPVVISNHNTPFTRELYKDAGARTHRFQVRRTISCNAQNRSNVSELLAVF